MFVDIHTHSHTQSNYPAIRNLSIMEADAFFSTTDIGTVSVGIHPWSINDIPDNFFSKLNQWVMDKRCVAIGECGLDKNSNAPIAQQLFVFQQHIEISEQVGKPILIHCVGCFNELLELKKLLQPQQLWIIHGFRGKPELAKQLLRAGCALSFGEHFNPDSVRLTSPDKLFIETDESTKTIESIYNEIAHIKEMESHKLSAGEKFFNKHVEK